MLLKKEEVIDTEETDRLCTLSLKGRIGVRRNVLELGRPELEV